MPLSVGQCLSKTDQFWPLFLTILTQFWHLLTKWPLSHGERWQHSRTGRGETETRDTETQRHRDTTAFEQWHRGIWAVTPWHLSSDTVTLRHWDTEALRLEALRLEAWRLEVLRLETLWHETPCLETLWHETPCLETPRLHALRHRDSMPWDTETPCLETPCLWDTLPWDAMPLRHLALRLHALRHRDTVPGPVPGTLHQYPVPAPGTRYPPPAPHAHRSATGPPRSASQMLSPGYVWKHT